MNMTNSRKKNSDIAEHGVPIGCMYGTSTYNYPLNLPHVSKYSIHGNYGMAMLAASCFMGGYKGLARLLTEQLDNSVTEGWSLKKTARFFPCYAYLAMLLFGVWVKLPDTRCLCVSFSI